jgi:hypothetical protein
MSEYQYYEFQAIDRPLSGKEMDRLRSYSTRARITTTSFVNEYQWGNFKGDADGWIDRYFDAFMYIANTRKPDNRSSSGSQTGVWVESMRNTGGSSVFGGHDNPHLQAPWFSTAKTRTSSVTARRSGGSISSYERRRSSRLPQRR